MPWTKSRRRSTRKRHCSKPAVRADQASFVQGHYNEKLHAVAGQQIADYIRQHAAVLKK